jgi:hypothetical protein
LAVGSFSLAKIIKDTIDLDDKTAKLSTRLGISTEALSQYRFVAERSGVDFNVLTLGFQRMTRRVAEAAQGTGEAQGALRELGLSASALTRLPLDQQFEIVAEQLSKVGVQADQVRLAMKLFDSEGVALVQTMQKGAAGIQEMRAEADRLGVTLTTEAAAQAEAAKDEMVRFDAAISALSNNIARGLVPSLTDAAKGFNVFFFGTEIQKTRREIEQIQEEMQDISSTPDLIGGGLSRFEQGRLETLANELLDLQKQLEQLETAGQLTVSDQFTTDIANAGSRLAEALELSDRLNASIDAAARSMDLIGEIDLTGVGDTEVSEEFNNFLDAMIDKRTRIDSIVASTVTNEERLVEQVAFLTDALDDLIEKREELERIPVEALSDEQANRLLALEESINEILEARRRLGEELLSLDNEFQSLEQFADQAARNMQDIFAEFLFDPFEDGLKGMLNAFSDMVRRMIAELIAAQLLTALFGFFGGAAGAGVASAGTSGGSVPGRQHGGPVGMGGTFLVGENGPELFVPPVSGKIIPNHAKATQSFLRAITARQSGGPVGAGRLFTVGERGPELFQSRNTANNQVSIAPVTNINTGGGGIDIATLIPILEQNNEKVKGEILDAFDRGTFS